MKKISKMFFTAFLAFVMIFSIIGFTACRDETLCEHVWNDGIVKTEASCTANGSKTVKCTKCGEEKDVIINAIGHSYDDGTVTEYPKCTEVGEKTFECTRCGNTTTEDVAATGHEYSTEGVVTASPSCVLQGTTSYYCTYDGCDAARSEAIAATGHTDTDHDGYCDVCNEFFGSESWDLTSFMYEGPWTAGQQGQVLCYYYNLSESTGTTQILSIDSETTHGEASTSLLADFTDSCKASSSDGAWTINFPIENLIENENYTLVFWAKTDGEFTGNLNKMLNNDNFGNNSTCQDVTYDTIYSSETLNSAEWTKVVVKFRANPHTDGTCQFRVACDVGLDGWTGKLWLSDFAVYDTEYYDLI